MNNNDCETVALSLLDILTSSDGGDITTSIDSICDLDPRIGEYMEIYEDQFDVEAGIYTEADQEMVYRYGHLWSCKKGIRTEYKQLVSEIRSRIQRELDNEH